MDDCKANTNEAVESVCAVEEGLNAIHSKVLECQSSVSLSLFTTALVPNLEDLPIHALVV